MNFLSLMTVAVLITGCVLSATGDNSLPLKSITVSASDSELNDEFEHQLANLALTGNRLISLTLRESTSNSITARAADGSGSKRRLSYALHYRIETTDQPEFNGVIRKKQSLDHSENTHLANRLAFERFFFAARTESIDKLINTLKIRNWQ